MNHHRLLDYIYMSKQDNPLLRKLSETFTNGRCITTTEIKFVKHKIFPVQNNHIAVLIL